MGIIKKIDVRRTLNSMDVGEQIEIPTADVNISTLRVIACRVFQGNQKKFMITQNGNTVTATRVR